MGRETEGRMKLMRGCVCTLYDDCPPVPSEWSPRDRDACVEVSHFGLRVVYCGAGESEHDGASARADCIVPTNGVALFYFEVKIVNAGECGLIGVGLSASSVDLNHLPGWDDNSLGYHSDDGNKFRGSGIGQSYGPSCTTNDVIGVCWNLIDHTVAFTKNGVFLGIAFRDVQGRYFPTVGLQSQREVVEANFGASPFVFDIEGHARAQRQSILDNILMQTIPGDLNTLSEVVLDYLLHNGYVKSATAFAKDVGKLHQLEGETADMRKRQALCDLVRKGEIDKAFERIHEEIPELLKTKPETVFALRCQQSIEIARKDSPAELLDFAREYLAQYQNMGDQYTEVLYEVLVLLAYPNISQSPYADMLDFRRRDRVAEELNVAVLAMQNRPSRSTLHRLIAHTQETIVELCTISNGPAALVSVDAVIATGADNSSTSDSLTTTNTVNNARADSAPTT